MLGKLRDRPEIHRKADSSSHSTIELKENTVIIVLGASGDLAKKKTVSALFRLCLDSFANGF